MTAKRSVVTLDIARLFAAIVVLIYHFLFFSWVDTVGGGGIRDVIGVSLVYPEAVPFSWWGWIGVEVFFVISGFVITISATDKSAIAFVIDRIARLYPALLFFSFLGFIVILRLDAITINSALYRLVNTVFLNPKGPWIDGVVWTLVAEAIFYAVIASILLFGSSDRIATVARYALLFIVAFWMIVIGHVLLDFGRVGTVFSNIATSFGGRIILITTGGFFLLGIFGSEVYSKGLSTSRLYALVIATACCIAAIAARAVGTHGVTQFHQSPVVPILIWLGCIWTCITMMIWENRSLPNLGLQNFARALGLMTYPLYLVHEITGGWILGRLVEFGVDRWSAALLTGLIVLSLSYGFAVWIEPKLRRILGFDLLKRRVRLRTDRNTIPAPLSNDAR